MILCRWNGDWYLSTGVNAEQRTCGLRCGKEMPHPSSFQPLPPAGAVVHGRAPVRDTKFYPELRFRQVPVKPYWWQPGTSEPVLRCHVGDWIPWELAHDQAKASELIEALTRDGWLWDQRAGGWKFIHVDDLEKIEGPPPEGPF
jgi:hypothetical protein